MLRTALLFAALLPAAAVAGASSRPSATLASHCPSTSLLPASEADGTARLRRLDTLPPANEILTVLRTEGGCQKPVVVRYGIGGAAPSDGQSTKR